MPIRAILFDLDGTLIDQFEAIHRAFARVLTQMGYPKPSYEKVKSFVVLVQHNELICSKGSGAEGTGVLTAEGSGVWR